MPRSPGVNAMAGGPYCLYCPSLLAAFPAPSVALSAAFALLAADFAVASPVVAADVAHPDVFARRLSVVVLAVVAARVAVLPSAAPADAVGFAAAPYSAAPPVDGRWLPAGFQAGSHWDCLHSDYLQSHSAADLDLRSANDSDSRRSRRWNSADWRSVDSSLAQSHSADDSDLHWADGSESRRLQRWNLADWHSVDSGLAGSDSAGWDSRCAARSPAG